MDGARRDSLVARKQEFVNARDMTVRHRLASVVCSLLEVDAGVLSVARVLVGMERVRSSVIGGDQRVRCEGTLMRGNRIIVENRRPAVAARIVTVPRVQE